MILKEMKLMQIGPSIRLGGGGFMNCPRLLKHVCIKGQTNCQQYWRFMKKVIAINPYDSQSQVIYDISGIAPALCCGAKRWGGLAPIIMEDSNDLSKSMGFPRQQDETNSLCGMVKAEQWNEIGQSIQRLCVGNHNSKDA